MASTTTTIAEAPPLSKRLAESRGFLSLGFMLPAAALLLVFLTYPLGLGIWLGFTDARIGRPGIFIGLENYEYLWDDAVFWLSVFNTLLYTISRLHPEIRARPVAGASPQREPAAEILLPRHRAAALGGADGALGHRLLVDLRSRSSRSSPGR